MYSRLSSMMVLTITPTHYEVSVVSGIANLSSVTDWKSIEPLPKIRLGKVPVAAVNFDVSRRKFVDGAFLTRIQENEQR